MERLPSELRISEMKNLIISLSRTIGYFLIHGYKIRDKVEESAKNVYLCADANEARSPEEVTKILERLDDLVTKLSNNNFEVLAFTSLAMGASCFADFGFLPKSEKVVGEQSESSATASAVEQQQPSTSTTAVTIEPVPSTSTAAVTLNQYHQHQLEEELHCHQHKRLSFQVTVMIVIVK